MSRKNVAGSNITDLVGVMPRVRLDGAAVAVYTFPELPGNALQFSAGEMVCLSGSAGNAVGLARPGTDASGYGILGFAADNASGLTSGFQGVYIATTETVFVGNVGHATSASAQTAATDVGQMYGLTSLSGRTYVDKGKAGNASTAMVRVLGLYEQDTHPCFYGRVYFTVFGTKCQTVTPWHTSITSGTMLGTVV